MKKYLATELHSRFWNPKWIREMQRGGYSGARELADDMENLYGWQATSKEIMDGSFWQNSLDVYIGDKHKLGLKEFLSKENPNARQAMLARLLEVDRQGSCQFSVDFGRTPAVVRLTFARQQVSRRCCVAVEIVRWEGKWTLSCKDWRGVDTLRVGAARSGKCFYVSNLQNVW